MEAVEFPQQTTVLAKDQPQYQPLPVRYEPDKEGQPMTCCFKLSPQELREINATGLIWHNQWTFGQPFHPIMMTTRSPFIDQSEELPKPPITMKAINEINTATQDGRLLMAAMAMITTQVLSDKTPDECLAILKDLAEQMN